jgi:hypothetical protein
VYTSCNFVNGSFARESDFALSWCVMLVAKKDCSFNAKSDVKMGL